jgi:hypothetical protein
MSGILVTAAAALTNIPTTADLLLLQGSWFQQRWQAVAA